MSVFSVYGPFLMIVREEERPSFGSLFRWRVLFLLLIVVVVVVAGVVAVVVQFLNKSGGVL